jgi:hypothetical protein
MHSGGPPNTFEVQQYLAENIDLLEAAHERLSFGRLHESLQYQLQLQQNLIYLATHADEDPQLEPMQFVGSQQQAAAGASRNTNHKEPEGISTGSGISSSDQRQLHSNTGAMQDDGST